uniref:Uncharacterized protein AlNc14C246G9556 n=1 Tax=Albugo laibachii Nc14 TaxID=890382 RepID=F0WT71_9STRA|nr:conserved hypothetical protein [Albugo laibachii Nc14]|eukprot:CCA24559.1 conserved hypothetical protein [Albugo laibachii Nc14]
MGNKHSKGRKTGHDETRKVSKQTSSSMRDDDESINQPTASEPMNVTKSPSQSNDATASFLLEDCLNQLDVGSILSSQEIHAIRNHLTNLLGQTEHDTIIISQEEFYRFLAANPNSLYVNRLYAIFDVSGQGYITFESLTRGLALLSRKATREQKLILAFHLLDLDGSGYITKKMTTDLLRSCLTECREAGMSLSDQQISRIVERTFVEADLDNNELVDLKEYQALDSKHSRIFDFLTVDALGVLNHLEKVRSAAQVFPVATH